MEIIHGSWRDLFNAPITECPLIIDTRSWDDYVRSHISGAVHSTTLTNLESILLADDAPWDLGWAFQCVYVIGDATNIPELVQELQQHGLNIYDRQRFPRKIVYLSDFLSFSNQFPKLISHNTKLRMDSMSPLAGIDIFYPSLICDWGLFLGSSVQAASLQVLQQLDISLVINVPNHFENTIEYLHLLVVDTEDQDMTNAFVLSCARLREAKKNSQKVLVHCHAGRSRSVSCVMYFLMHAENLSFGGALAHVKSCRRQASPNDGFIQQLLLSMPQ